MVAVFVALMFIGFILTDAIVQKLEARRAALVLSTAGAPALTAARPHRPFGTWVKVPEGVYLSEGHTWMLPERGEFRLGVDPLVGGALGTVTRVIPPRVGTDVWAGGPLLKLDLNGRLVTVAAPCSGRVVAVNGDLQDRPELAVRAPYGEGWVCSLLPTRLAQEKPRLRIGAKAAAWLEQEIDRFSEFLWVRVPADLAMGATSQDGGIPAPGALTQFEAQIWQAFEQEFLRPR